MLDKVPDKLVMVVLDKIPVTLATLVLDIVALAPLVATVEDDEFKEPPLAVG